MGGEGSTRWGCHARATCVEDCRSITVAMFNEVGGLKPVTTAGTMTLGGGVEADFVLVPEAQDDLLLVIQHQVTTPLGVRRTHEQTMHLRFRRPRRGKARWQFRCPITHRDGVCGRAAERLYMPPYRDDFGCRRCHALTYRSSQEQGRYFAHRRQMLRRAETVGLTAADIGLDMPEDEAVALLREILGGG